MPSSSTTRAPEALGPKKKQSPEKEGPLKEEDVKTLPTSSSTASKVEEDGGKTKVGLGEEAIEEHDISTPPDVKRPLFDDGQLRNLNELYQQAPWLYSKFETPETVQRPSFLDEEEGKREAQRFEESLRRQKIVKALEEKMARERSEASEALEKKKEVERSEKEEMSRQLRILMEENQRLRHDFEVVAVMASSTKAKEDEEGKKQSKQVRRLLEENLQLRSHLNRLGGQAMRPEEDGVFATPNGSAGHGTSAGGREAGGNKEEEERMKSEDEKRGKGKGARKPQETKGESLRPQTLDVILKLMEGMQEIQKKLVKGEGEDSQEAEVVRHSVELPKLQEWSPESGPIDFADWLLLLQPPMSDLSALSEEWWSQMVPFDACPSSRCFVATEEVVEVGKKSISAGGGGVLKKHFNVGDLGEGHGPIPA